MTGWMIDYAQPGQLCPHCLLPAKGLHVHSIRSTSTTSVEVSSIRIYACEELRKASNA